MHHDGDRSLRDIDWISRRWNGVQAYCDSKLFLTTLSALIARRWHDVHSNAVDPGWVPTRMGGAGAPDDLVEGHVTQVWLAVSDDPEASVTGKYWHHRQTHAPAAEVDDPAFRRAVEPARLPQRPAAQPAVERTARSFHSDRAGGGDPRADQRRALRLGAADQGQRWDPRHRDPEIDPVSQRS